MKFIRLASEANAIAYTRNYRCRHDMSDVVEQQRAPPLTGSQRAWLCCCLAVVLLCLFMKVLPACPGRLATGPQA